MGEFDSHEQGRVCLKAAKEQLQSIGLTSHQRHSIPEMTAWAIFDDVISGVNSNHTKGVNDFRLPKRTIKVVKPAKSSGPSEIS
jgi:hypothetical protein